MLLLSLWLLLFLLHLLLLWLLLLLLWMLLWLMQFLLHLLLLLLWLLEILNTITPQRMQPWKRWNPALLSVWLSTCSRPVFVAPNAVCPGH